MSNRFWAGAIVTLALILATFAFSTADRPFAYAAPLAAGITPVGGANPVKGDVGQMVPLVTAAVTADGRVCKDLRNVRTMDIQTVVEWVATPGVLTIKLEHSNDNVNFVEGPQIAATVIANAGYLGRYDQFGAFTCANFDIASPSSTNYANVKMLVLPRN